jgi:hypothetical protein
MQLVGAVFRREGTGCACGTSIYLRLSRYSILSEEDPQELWPSVQPGLHGILMGILGELWLRRNSKCAEERKWADSVLLPPS